MRSDHSGPEYRKLHAEWYDLVSGQIDHGPEIEFWWKAIESAGGSALELGCGTGRVLVPLLEQGLDIEGLDTSEAMLARCEATCRERRLRPVIHRQSMLALDLPRRYGLIFLDSGGLGLFTDDADIAALFESVMRHLEPGGRFIYEYQPLPEDPDAVWNDDRWRGDWLPADPGSVIAWRSRNRYDATRGVWERLFVVEKFVDGRLEESEANERAGRFFGLEEALDFARAAGFEAIEAYDWLSEDPPRSDSTVVTVRCRKP